MGYWLKTARRLAVGTLVVGMVFTGAIPASAEDEAIPADAASEVREHVLSHRLDVLTRIAAVFSSNNERGAQAELAARNEAERAAAEPESSEQDGAVSEVSEEDTGGEDAVEDEEVLELPETGAGWLRSSLSDAVAATSIALFGALGTLGLVLRRRANHLPASPSQT